MRTVFVAPWKLSKGPAAELAQLYLQRLAKTHPVEVIVPSSPLAQGKDVSQFLLRESKKLISDGCALCCLDENGKGMGSDAFARFFEKAEIQGRRGVAFCFGAADGLPGALAELGQIELISLSQLTMAHELAFAVLAEQVYRARCILAHHPYHHGGASELARTLKR